MGCNCKNKSVNPRNVLKEFPEYCTPYEQQQKDHTLFTDYSEEEKRIILKQLGLLDKAFAIVNQPDEEDLTNISDKLKFKNKDYKPSEFSGLGRVFLRKNLINKLDGTTINKLTQEMLSSNNQLLNSTIFIIQYDYDLDGDSITLPADCVLMFIGGSIKNGTLVCNNTSIYNVFLDYKKYLNVTLQGNFATGTTLLQNDKLTYWDGSAWQIFNSNNCEQPEKTVLYSIDLNGALTAPKVIKTKGTDSGIFAVTTTLSANFVQFKVTVPQGYTYKIEDDGEPIELTQLSDNWVKYPVVPKTHYFQVFFIKL